MKEKIGFDALHYVDSILESDDIIFALNNSWGNIGLVLNRQNIAATAEEFDNLTEETVKKGYGAPPLRWGRLYSFLVSHKEVSEELAERLKGVISEEIDKFQGEENPEYSKRLSPKNNKAGTNAGIAKGGYMATVVKDFPSNGGSRKATWGLGLNGTQCPTSN